jgi:hypothetical protein
VGKDDRAAAWLRSLFHRYRASLMKHPNVASLLGGQLVSNAGLASLLIERVLAALQTAGFNGKELVNSFNTVIAALLRFVTLGLAPAPSDDADG